jgi:hypothetical protein
VAGFTVVTILNVIMLQSQPEWAVGLDDIAVGLTFRLPEKYTDVNGKTFYPLATALATFGIIGVGASELISYPYWCLEKGYARFVGPRDETSHWAHRGAATLGRIHLIPKGVDMIRTLSVMYEPVFGGWTQPVFLFGAFAVLYSTYFVAIAGHARVCSDALRVFGLLRDKGEISTTAVKWFSGVYPFICLAIYLIYAEPATLVLASGAMQAMMLPMLSFAALHFRYRRTDNRIKPSLAWDLCLWVSAIGMLIAGGWLALQIVFPQLKEIA